MAAILKQRHLLISKIFEIIDGSLKVKIKTPLSYIENNFTFEELGIKVIHQKKPYIPGIIGCAATFVLSIILFFSYLSDSNDTPLYSVLICVGICIFFAFISYINHQNLTIIYLFNGLPLQFYGNSPSQPEVAAFLSELFAAQKKYLINRYAKLDLYLSVEQIVTNLKWLWDRKIIDDQELNDLRAKLLPKPTNADSVGFKLK